MAISSLSLLPHKLTLWMNTEYVATATGFFMHYMSQHFLVTNRHVLSGIDTFTGRHLGKKCEEPDEVEVHYIDTAIVPSGSRKHRLVDANTGKPLWHSLPISDKIDIAILPVTQKEVGPIGLFDVQWNNEVCIDVGMPVYILGFPMGRSSGDLPIWKSGFIASEPDVHDNGLPVVLVDSATQKGMSGSPVVVMFRNQYPGEASWLVLQAGENARFLGIYAGRENDTSTIGRVYRPDALRRVCVSYFFL